MSDDYPTWPPDWLEDRTLATEQVLAEHNGISFVSALRSDDRVLLSVRWPEGRRWMLIDPVGNDAPEALRIGEKAEDPETGRIVEAVWSQALAYAKQLIDGELPTGPSTGAGKPGRRRWRRNQG